MPLLVGFPMSANLWVNMDLIGEISLMDHLDFNSLFDQEFANPLIEQGFSFVGKGKTLMLERDNRDLRIIRVGGKSPHPGIMKSVICFRHSFLRLVSSDDTKTKTLIVDDFPRKLTFDDFDTVLKPTFNYRPNNSGRWPVHEFAYGVQTESDVAARLRKLLELVEKCVLPWMNSLTEESELEQLRLYGEKAWCEKRWIEDYEQYVSDRTKERLL